MFPVKESTSLFEGLRCHKFTNNVTNFEPTCFHHDFGARELTRHNSYDKKAYAVAVASFLLDSIDKARQNIAMTNIKSAPKSAPLLAAANTSC